MAMTKMMNLSRVNSKPPSISEKCVGHGQLRSRERRRQTTKREKLTEERIFKKRGGEMNFFVEGGWK